MKYLQKRDLEKINIDAYADEIRIMCPKCFGDALSDDDFVLDTADIFRQGVCQLFAYRLNEIFGYPVMVISRGKSFHVFCKSNDDKYYIDVRGVTDSFDEFLKGTFVSSATMNDIRKYEFVEDDFNGDYYEVGMAFALCIIKNNMDRYTASD